MPVLAIMRASRFPYLARDRDMELKFAKKVAIHRFADRRRLIAVHKRQGSAEKNRSRPGAVFKTQG